MYQKDYVWVYKKKREKKRDILLSLCLSSGFKNKNKRTLNAINDAFGPTLSFFPPKGPAAPERGNSAANHSSRIATVLLPRFGVHDADLLRLLKKVHQYLSSITTSSSWTPNYTRFCSLTKHVLKNYLR